MSLEVVSIGSFTAPAPNNSGQMYRGLFGGFAPIQSSQTARSGGNGTLVSGEMAKIIDLISEGEIDGLTEDMGSVYLDGVPVLDKKNGYTITNFDDVKVELATGVPNQNLLTNFPNIFSDVAVNTEIANVGGGGAILKPIMTADGTSIDYLAISSGGGGYTLIDETATVAEFTGYAVNSTLYATAGDASLVDVGNLVTRDGATGIVIDSVFVKQILIPGQEFLLSKRVNIFSSINPGVIKVKKGGAIISITDPTNVNNNQARFVVSKVSKKEVDKGTILEVTKFDGGTYTPGVVPIVEVSGNPLVRTILDTNGVDAIKVTISTPSLYFSNDEGGTDPRKIQVLVEYKPRADQYYTEAKVTTEFINNGIVSNPTSQNPEIIPYATVPAATSQYRLQVTWSHSIPIAHKIFSETISLQYRKKGSTDAWEQISVLTCSGASSIAQSSNVLQNNPNYTPITTQNPIFSPITGFGGSTSGFGPQLISAVDNKEILINSDAAFAYEFQLVKLTNNFAPYSTFGSTINFLKAETVNFSGIITIEGKALSKYQKTVVFPVHGKGPFEVRLTRLTADSESPRLVNDTFWDSYAAVYYDKLSYPFSGIAGIEFNAKQFSRIPSRAYKIRGIKCAIPSNYNPVTREYTGIWDGTFKTKTETINGIVRTFIDKQYTNNPAWVLLDLLSNNRYGLGDYLGVRNNHMFISEQYPIDLVSAVLRPDGFIKLSLRMPGTSYSNKVKTGDYLKVSGFVPSDINGTYLVAQTSASIFVLEKVFPQYQTLGTVSVEEFGYVEHAFGNTLNVPGYSIDIYSLYKIAQYCDESVPMLYKDPGTDQGTEPRFTCNLYLQTQEEAYTVITNLASIFRGMMYWSGGQLTATQDSPASRIALFNNTNVVDGNFEYGGVGLKGRHTVAMVSWNDPDNLYKQNIEYVEYPEGIERYGYNPTDVVAMGCTSRSQAHRLGKAILYTEYAESETLSFKVGLDGALVYPGAVIGVQNKDRAGRRLGGRAVTASANTFTIDAPITVEESKTYTLYYITPKGEVSQGINVINNPGSHLVLQLETSISPEALPLPAAIWSVSVSDLSIEDWRVISISENAEDQTINVNCVKHNPNKYNIIEDPDSTQSFTTPIQSYLSRERVEVPTNLVVTDTLYKVSAKQFGIKMLLSWDSDNTANYYRVKYRIRDDNGLDTWKERSSGSNSIELFDGIEETTYELEVRAFNALGFSSPPLISTYTVRGKLANPLSVTNFSVGIEGDKIRFNWDTSKDLDFDRFEIRKDSWYSQSGGSGYTNTDLVIFNGGGGTGAEGTLITSAGEITGFNLTNGGTGYLGVPNITVQGLGSGVSLVPEVLNGEVVSVNILTDENLVYRGFENTLLIPNIYNLSTTTDFYIRAVDTTEHYSSQSASATLELRPPNSVADLAVFFGMDKVMVSWTAAQVNALQLPVAVYEIFVDSIRVAETTNTYFEYFWNSVDFTDTISIITRDILGNISSPVSQAVSIQSPVTPTIASATVSSGVFKASWSAVLSGNRLSIQKYNLYFGLVGNPQKIDEVVGTTYEFNWVYDQQPRVFGVQTVDILGNTSAIAISTASVVLPNAPSALAAQLKESKILLNWQAAEINPGSLPISFYEIREGGASWNEATFVAKIPATNSTELQYLYGITSMLDSGTSSVGTFVYDSGKTFRVASLDSAGNYSSSSSSLVVTIESPPAINSFAVAVEDRFINSTWNSILSGSGSTAFVLPIDRYEIRYSRSSTISEGNWTTAVQVAALSGTTIQFDPPINSTKLSANNQTGEFYYFIRAVDLFGKYGSQSVAVLAIEAPTAPINLNNKVIDNNVLLLWEEPTNKTLPISRYILSSSLDTNATFSTSNVLGEKDGRFTSVFEETSGVYKYFITPVDSAGNIGQSSFTLAEVKQPPDFVLTTDILRNNFNTTAYNSVVVTQALSNVGKSVSADTIGLDRIFGPYSAQTFAQHFTNTSASSTAYPYHTTAWSTPNDQVSAGFPVFVQPGNLSGNLTETYDFQATINTNQYISVFLNTTSIAGTTGSYRIILSTSTDGTAFTGAVTSSTVPVSTRTLSFGTFATGFRYVRVRIELDSGTNGQDVIRIDDYRLKLSVKYTNDGGSGSVSNTGIFTIPVTAGGSGYTAPPAVGISGGGGTGAKAYALISGGAVTAIQVVNSGSGYTASPSISFVGGGGTGAGSGTITFTSAVSGAYVGFNYDYIDVNLIQTSYGGTSSGIAIYDFIDIPNPKYFRVLLFNSSGTAILGNFSWSAKGTI